MSFPQNCEGFKFYCFLDSSSRCKKVLILGVGIPFGRNSSYNCGTWVSTSILNRNAILAFLWTFECPYATDLAMDCLDAPPELLLCLQVRVMATALGRHRFYRACL